MYIQIKPQIYSLLTFPVVYEGDNVKRQSVDFYIYTFLYLFSAFHLTTLVQTHSTSYLTVNMARLPVHLLPMRGLVHLEHHHCVSLHEEQLWSYHHPPP